MAKACPLNLPLWPWVPVLAGSFFRTPLRSPYCLERGSSGLILPLVGLWVLRPLSDGETGAAWHVPQQLFFLVVVLL